MANFYRSPMDLHQAINQGKFNPAKQMLSGNGGPFKVVRFEVAKGAFCVVLENSKGDHESLNGNATKWLNLSPMPPRELTYEPMDM